MVCLTLLGFQFYFVLQLKYFISVLSEEQNVTNSLFILAEGSLPFIYTYLLKYKYIFIHIHTYMYIFIYIYLLTGK